MRPEEFERIQMSLATDFSEAFECSMGLVVLLGWFQMTVQLEVTTASFRSNVNTEKLRRYRLCAPPRRIGTGHILD